MSNKTQLQSNNTALDALIARVNAAKDTAASLPSAGGGSGGGSIEVCTGKLVAPSGMPGFMNAYTLTCTDSNLNVITHCPPDMDSEYTFTVVKNTIVFTIGGLLTATSGCTKLGGGTGAYAYLITDNNFVITSSI